MRILIAYWDLTVGGVQHMTTKLANQWVLDGHDVTIAVSKRWEGLELYPLNAKIEILDYGHDTYRAYLFGLTRLLRKRPNIDVVFSATTGPNIAAVFAHRVAKSNAKLILSERDNPVEGLRAVTKWKEKIIWRLKPLAYRRADALVCVSTPLAESLSLFTGISRDKLIVIHNPADPDGEDFLESAPPHSWFEDKQSPVIVAAGRFHPQKNFPMLVRAFSQLRKRRQVRMIILGEGADRSAIEAAITDCEVSDSVLLPGFQPDILPWLVHADVFAMSSTFEGFGNVLVQALAAGTRIVSTDCPDGPAEILGNGSYGALTPPGDACAFADALAEVLDEPRNVERQRARARDFSTKKISAQYLKLFAECS